MTLPGGHHRAGDQQVQVRTVTCWVHVTELQQRSVVDQHLIVEARFSL
jgi:hypothetical protein